MATQKVIQNSKPATKKKSNALIIILIVVGVLFGLFLLLIVLALVFGSPSAETVFKDMQKEMLQTKSVTISQDYKGTGSAGESINLKSKAYLNLESSKSLVAKGDFTLNLTSSGTPLSASASFVKSGDNTYIKFNDISSSNAELAPTFSTINSKLKGKWVKVKDGDNFSSFASIPIDAYTGVLPTPYANLTESQQKTVLKILQDKKMFTIQESSKVEIGDVSAYKYDLAFNENQYKNLVKTIGNYVDYFKPDDTNDSEIKDLTVWVKIKTSQIIKIEFSGTSKEGDIEGTIAFSGYNQKLTVNKPSDYSLESELLK